MHSILRVLGFAALFVILVEQGGWSQETQPGKASPNPNTVKQAHACPPFFRSLPPLGAETPRALAERYLRAYLTGDKASIYSCYELSSAASLAAATLDAENGAMVKVSVEYARTVRKKFGQRGIDLLREEIGFSLKGPAPGDLNESIKEWLGKLEIVTEGGKSLARVPSPSSRNSWLQMHKLQDRWYVMPYEDIQNPAAAMQFAMAASAISSTFRQLQLIGPAVEKSSTLKDFQTELRKIKAKMDAVVDLEPPLDFSVKKTHAEKLPPKHFRIKINSNPSLSDAMVLDFNIETPQPAEIMLWLQGPGANSGSGSKTVMRQGDSIPTEKVTVLIDRLVAGDYTRTEGKISEVERLFHGQYTKFSSGFRSSGGGAQYFKIAQESEKDRSIRMTLRAGVYDYTGNDLGPRAIQVCSYGPYRMLLLVYEPKPGK